MKILQIAAIILTVLLPAVSAADFATTVMNATFKFYHPDSTSTCMLVRRDNDARLYLVTCRHTLENTNGESATIVLRQPQDDGSFKRLDHRIPIRRNDKPLWTQHPEQDVAVLILPTPLPVDVEPLPESSLLAHTSVISSQIPICRTIFLLTYPERFEANSASFPVARQGTIASPPTLPLAHYPTFLGDFTTFAGDSGGPIFVEGPRNTPQLLGIMIGQHHHNITSTNTFQETKLKLPLGMGIILHADFIRQTLAQAASQN